MNNSIKEILGYLKNNTFIPDETKRKYKILHRDEVNKLLNYITNLQKENLKLISENEAIKNIKYTVDETIYKQRNEKAIEYIKNTTLYGFRSGKTLLTNYLDDLLNILQGGDEN